MNCQIVSDRLYCLQKIFRPLPAGGTERNMKVTIVDDTREDAELLLDALERFGRENKEEMDVTLLDSAASFLRSYEQNKPELVILDIDMPGINGMEAAHKIRETDENVCLLFVTNMRHYALEGYSVDALDYLIKPVTYEDFVLRMKKARRYILRNRDEKVVLHVAGGIVTLNVSDIYYVESMLHNLTYHAKSGDYRVRESMSRAEELLRKYSFASCNKSYLVNLRHVEAISRDEVTVAGAVLKMSRGKKQEFINRYTRYLGGMRQ